jgi:thiamine-phosphate pyrophosphorylase
MKLHNVDYSLYLVTDRGLARGRSTLEIVSAAVHGGATVVQLREKDCYTRDFIEQALTIKEFLKDRGVPLIINDRLDVAQAVKADGVHLGQTDMPLGVAKKILGDSMIIGISAESLQDAVEAEKGGADYLGVSPIYTTPTKTGQAPAGWHRWFEPGQRRRSHSQRRRWRGGNFRDCCCRRSSSGYQCVKANY